MNWIFFLNDLCNIFYKLNDSYRNDQFLNWTWGTYEISLSVSSLLAIDRTLLWRVRLSNVLIALEKLCNHQNFLRDLEEQGKLLVEITFPKDQSSSSSHPIIFPSQINVLEFTRELPIKYFKSSGLPVYYFQNPEIGHKYFDHCECKDCLYDSLCRLVGFFLLDCLSFQL